jgi:hypothetical protein
VAEPQLNGKTNAALAEWAINLRAALRQANSDKAELQTWVEENQ